MSSKSYPLNIISKIFQSDYRDNVAFIDSANRNTVSYGELNEAILQTALLIKKRVQGEKVLIFLPSGFSFVVSLFGVILSGNIPILVNDKLKAELESLVNPYTSVLTDDLHLKHLEKFSDINNDRVILFNLSQDYDIDAGSFKGEYLRDDPMLYLFTSGSTGDAKLVAKTFENLMAEVEYLATLLETGSDDVYLPLVPSFHIYGLLFTVLLPFYVGAKVRLDIPFSPLNLIEDGLANANIMIGNPTQYSALKSFLLQFKDMDFSHVKYCISSTMPLNPEIISTVYETLGLKIMELYGSTETGGIAFRKYYENKSWTFFPYVKRDLIEAENVLMVQSPGGSLPDTLRGDSHQEDYWHETGDVIQMNDDNTFELLGRSNQIIKVGGNRVSALEVEAAIKKSALVQEVVVTAQVSERLLGEAIVAYIVPNNLSEYNLARKIKAYCQSVMPDFKVPKAFVIMDSIPKTANGKVSFEELPKIHA